ncbi:MAG: YjbQ family protein [Acidobacteriota bacterium]|nr:MAG: YjbQ family protein [Acidobacteriota bacterium]
MPAHAFEFELETKGFCDVVDVTGRISRLLEQSAVTNGLLTIFTPGATAGVTCIEYESGAVRDLKRAIERMAPQDVPYDHDARWGDGNGFSHVRAALIGPSMTIPVSHGQLTLGTWQQVVVIDFDNRSRQRRVRVQIVGQ